MKKDEVKHHTLVSSVSTPERIVVYPCELEARKKEPVWQISSYTFAAWVYGAYGSSRRCPRDS